MSKDFRERPTYYGELLALVSEITSGGASDHIINLDNNSRAVGDPITDYPLGTSVFLSDSDQVPAFGWPFGVHTVNIMTLRAQSPTASGPDSEQGYQLAFSTDDWEIKYRIWALYEDDWGEWLQINAWDDISGKPTTFPPSTHEHDHVANLETDSQLFADPPSAYPLGASIMPSTDQELGGSFAYEFVSGTVETTRFHDEYEDRDRATQILKASGPGTFPKNIYMRNWVYQGSEFGYAWTSFLKLSTEGHEHNHITPLLDYTFDADAPIYDYPVGVSFVRAGDYPEGWPTFDEGISYDVVTYLTDDAGHQVATSIYSGGSMFFRQWNNTGGETGYWGEWQQIWPTSVNWEDIADRPSTFSPEMHFHNILQLIPTDSQYPDHGPEYYDPDTNSNFWGCEYWMYSDDTATSNRFANDFSTPVLIQTTNSPSFHAMQVAYFTETARAPAYRVWDVGDEEWGAWLQSNDWSTIANKPSTFPPETHEHDHTVVLAVSTRDNDSLPSEYPLGISEMPIDGAGGWPTLGTVKTARFVLDTGEPDTQTEWTHQVAISAYYDKAWIRSYYDDVVDPPNSGWSSWKEQLGKAQADLLYLNTDNATIPDDSHAASVGLASYPKYISHMRITPSFATSGGWPGAANQKLVVTLYHNSTAFRGVQTIYDIVDGTVKHRIYDGTSWSSWKGPDWADIQNKPSTFPPSAHTLGSHSDWNGSPTASQEIRRLPSGTTSASTTFGASTDLTKFTAAAWQWDATYGDGSGGVRSAQPSQFGGSTLSTIVNTANTDEATFKCRYWMRGIDGVDRMYVEIDGHVEWSTKRNHGGFQDTPKITLSPGVHLLKVVYERSSATPDADNRLYLDSVTFSGLFGARYDMSTTLQWRPIDVNDWRPTSVANLEADSRLHDDPATNYPVGFSVMPAIADTTGTFGGEWIKGVVETSRYEDDVDIRAEQLMKSDNNNYYKRSWHPEDSSWGDWRLIYDDTYHPVAWDEIGGTPSTFPPSAHEHDHIIPLAEDAHIEDDPITSYPSGVSVMPESGDPSWNGNTQGGTIVTFRTSGGGRQQATFSQGGRYDRDWVLEDEEWAAWEASVTTGQFEGHGHSQYAPIAHPLWVSNPTEEADPEFLVDGDQWIRTDLDPPEIRTKVAGVIKTVGYVHDHDHMTNLAFEAHAESDPPQDYPLGTSVMPVGFGTNGSTWLYDQGWEGFDGLVITHRYSETTYEVAWQRVVVTARGGEVYERDYSGTGSTWSPSWRQVDKPQWSRILGKPSTFPPETHDHDHITNLITDSRVIDDSPSAWPEGLSAMKSTDGDTEGTFAYDWSSATVRTHRSGTTAHQEMLVDGDVEIYHRDWDEDSTSWSSFSSPATSNHIHQKLWSYYPDGHTTVHDPGAWDPGTAVMFSYPEHGDPDDFAQIYDVGIVYVVNTAEYSVENEWRAKQALYFTESNRAPEQRYWTGSAWSAWSALNGSGDVDHIINLPTDSRLFAEGPSEFPEGLSVMHSEVSVLTGSFYAEWDAGYVQTFRTGVQAAQLFLSDNPLVPTRVQIAWRRWDDEEESWTNFEVANDYAHLINLPSTFPPSAHDHDHVTNLTNDSLDVTSGLSAYPYGVSEMYSDDQATDDTFAWWDSTPAIVRTMRMRNSGNTADAGYQEIFQPEIELAIGKLGQRARRVWKVDTSEWSLFVYGSHWLELEGQPSTFPPEAHEHNHIINLESDSRMYADPPTEYPDGTSWMQAEDSETEGTFGYEFNMGLVRTERYLEDGAERSFQYMSVFWNDGRFSWWRIWSSIDEEWSAWSAYNDWGDLTNKPSTFPPSAHEHDHITNLAEDSRVMDDPPSEYPIGLSSMASEDTTTPGTFGEDWGGQVRVNTQVFDLGGGAYRATQEIAPTNEWDSPSYRYWQDTEEWSDPKSFLTQDQAAASYSAWDHEHSHIINLATDSLLTTAAPTAFPIGTSVMPSIAQGTANTFAEYYGEDAIVRTTRYQAGATERSVQELFDAEGNVEPAIRTWSGSGWSGWEDYLFYGNFSWANLSGKPSTFPPSTHASTHTNGTDDIQNATASQKGLMTSAYASKLDGIESSATADQTAAEIRAAIKLTEDAFNGAAALSSFDVGASYLPISTSSTGWPLASTTFHVLILKQDGSSAKQVAIQRTAARHWERHWTGSAWSSWVETTDVANLQGYSALATDAEVTSAISAHEALSDPHPGYLTPSEANALYKAIGYVPDWTDITNKPSSFTPSTHASTHTNGTDDVQSATASQKGLMTSAYASKLDGIESGATADQTASEILTAIKTVDGSGSGLDADLFDGNNSSAFATATELSDHLADTSDAHDASAISVLDAGNNFTGADVEAVLAELRAAIGGMTLTEIEKDLGSTIKRAGSFLITGLSGLTTNKPVAIHQLPGPYTNKGTRMDEAEMDNLTVVGRVLNSTTIQCYWRSVTFVRGNFKFAYTVSA